MEKTNRTVIITGGGRGLGAAISRAFFQEGDHVLIGSRTDSRLAREFGSRGQFEPVDVRQEEGHRHLVRSALEWTGQINLYINGAGFSEWRPIQEVDEEFWSRMIDTNLKGTLWGCKVAAENLKAGGSIINISSLAGKRGSTNNSVYCASKFGVNGITQALAKELGPRGIRVNAVCPVYVETEGLIKALSDTDSPAGEKDVHAYLASFAESQSAMRRLPTAEEVAKLCLFLASDQASAITGQSIHVDCGVLPQ